jgi:hypothetical protein
MRESVVPIFLGELDPALHAQILGGADAATVERELERLGAVTCFHAEASIGALFGIELADGNRVALKVHQQTLSENELDAVQGVQSHLAANGFPCPKPLLTPTPFLDRLATGEEWRDDGVAELSVDAGRREQMARLLARQIGLCEALPAADVLTWVPRDDRLWPTPHNALFDFDRTRRGAEWIDEIAAAAREANRGGPRVLAHQDWTLKHFRWDGTKACVIYDWDAVFCDNESISVGAAAATHTYPPGAGLPSAPSVEDALAFLDAYELARPLDGATRRAAETHAVYSVAYTSRCEHALERGRGSAPATRARTVLREFAERLLGDAPVHP